MGRVDFDFKPSVPVFDANVSLGRRHDKRVSVDDAEGTLAAMETAGVDRALVYSPHAVYWDADDGNQALLDMVRDHPGLVPQLVASPYENLDAFAAQIKDTGVRSVRMLPTVYAFPFREWVVGRWLDWMAAERVPLWLPVSYPTERMWNPRLGGSLDPTDVYETLSAHPDVTAVLCGAVYTDLPWAILLLKSVPNLYLELSRFVSTDGVTVALDAIGDERILFGSSFPDSSISPQLYHLHRCGLSEAALARICSGNLDRILGME